ncbi:MAG: calcium/proton exchanger [Chloroflexi bacterium RBG_16_50_9]|nr:MAG: calcium/proton exchanger [Chloroflexi bacterium RBG_16_50_9]
MRSYLFPYSMLVFLPVSIWLHLTQSNPILVAIVTILAIIPITSLIARSTQDLSLRTSTVVGSLLNATFGNAIELFIAIFAIKAGLLEMVKASLIGSIVINILLLIGLSMIFGGIRYREQKFNRDSVGVSSTMLLIAVAGLSLPTIYSVITGNSAFVMSQAVSITLGITYLLSLLFVLFTHRHLFEAKRDVSEQSRWGPPKASLVLALSIALAGVESDILVSVLQPIVQNSALHQDFVGLVIIAIITNVPEHVAAIRFGLRNNITLSMEIGMNSAIQIALFVAPILVFISPLMGGQLSLAFAPFQMIAMILAVMIINYLGSDGICNWLEGVQLAAVYIIIAIAFYFM